MKLNTVTLSVNHRSFPAYDAPDGVAFLNRMELRTGARPGKGAFCMLRSDYAALVDAAGKSAEATLSMQGDPGPGVSLTVIVAAAEPLVTTAELDDSGDLMKVTVLDTRCRNYNPVKKFYNVMQNGFPLDGGGNPQCYASTLHGGSPWAWKDILTDSTVVASSGIPSDLPSWTPYNIIFDNVSAATALDDIAARLFYVVGFDHQNATGGTGYGLSLIAPGDTLSANNELLRQIASANDGGGVADRNSSRLPGQIVVCFQGYNADDPTTDPFVHRSYEKYVNSGEDASTDYRVPLHVGEQIAILKGGAWSNQSTLDAIAVDMAPRCDTWISQDFAQQEFIGIWPLRPDGNWRSVTWVSDARGARTLVSTDNRRDWLPGDSIKDPIAQATNQEVIGVGGMTFAIGAGGTKVGWAASTSLPTGQYQYQVYQTVSQNQAGFDFVRAHPLIG